jgi:chromosome partitioning protein
LIIAICNHKGGTGKTTTTINLGKALVLRRKSVLLIDLDSQANLSYSLGLSQAKNDIGKVLFKKLPALDAIVNVEGMDILPATNKLHQYEEAIIKNSYGYHLIKDVVQDLNYDYILIDCPPAQSLLNINAFCAANKVLVPMLMDVLSLQGLNQIIHSVEDVKKNLNPKLEILGVLGVLVDDRRQLTRDVLEYIQSNYTIPVFNNYIRANVKAAEAPSFGKSVIEYAPDSNSAKDYISLCNELLKIVEESNQVSSVPRKYDFVL